jgi:Flp pilus assembly protein protease CpaA
MIAATTLLIGYQQVLGFLFLMSLCGGALALATLATERVGSARSCPDETQRGLSPAGRVRHWPVRQRSTVPYGVAVAAAGIVSLLVAR